MTSYESMRKKLAPLQLYSLDAGSEVDCELKAYAAGLEPLFDMLAELEREGFVDSALTYGLSRRERFIDREQAELTVEKRRGLLTGAERQLGVDATYNSFVQYLSDCGWENVTVREYPAKQVIHVYFDDDLTEGQQTAAVKKLRMAMPAHLPLHVYFHDGSNISL